MPPLGLRLIPYIVSLLAIAHYEDNHNYGINKVLTPLLEEVPQLAKQASIIFNLPEFTFL